MGKELGTSKRSGGARALKPRKARAPLTPEQRRFRRQVTLNLTVLVALLAGGGVGYSYLHGYVEHKLTFPADPPRVVLKNRPRWMTDFLAEQIINTVRPPVPHSTFDQKALVTAYDTLRVNPWIKSVNQVRRVYGRAPGDTIEIDCDYRAPAALVQWGEYFSLVDADGVKLPEQFKAQDLRKIMYAADGRVNVRLIQGVQRPPSEVGRKWIGEDLAAGIEMLALLAGKPYAEDVLRVDVSNYAGRVDAKEAHLVLYTRDGSEVRWGRPPGARDAFVEVRWDRKLQYMEWLVREFKRVDAGHSWVDLRFDEIQYPSAEAHTAAADDGTTH